MGWKKAIKEYEECFERYKKPEQSLEDYFLEISKEYELPYNGNTKEFIELARINAFLDETIDMLSLIVEASLNTNTNTAAKMK